MLTWTLPLPKKLVAAIAKHTPQSIHSDNGLAFEKMIITSIKTLPYGQQQILHGMYVEQQSIIKIAHTLSLSPASIRRHQSRALHTLRKACNPEYAKQIRGIFEGPSDV